MSSTADEAMVKVLGVLRVRVREAPYQTLGLAAALGLAGGARLWKRLASSLIGAGARIALAAVVPTLMDEFHKLKEERNGPSPRS